jgi:hypothetical protein
MSEKPDNTGDHCGNGQYFMRIELLKLQFNLPLIYSRK